MCASRNGYAIMLLFWWRDDESCFFWGLFSAKLNTPAPCFMLKFHHGLSVGRNIIHLPYFINQLDSKSVEVEQELGFIQRSHHGLILFLLIFDMGLTSKVRFLVISVIPNLLLKHHVWLSWDHIVGYTIYISMMNHINHEYISHLMANIWSMIIQVYPLFPIVNHIIRSVLFTTNHHGWSLVHFPLYSSAGSRTWPLRHQLSF